MLLLSLYVGCRVDSTVLLVVSILILRLRTGTSKCLVLVLVCQCRGPVAPAGPAHAAPQVRDKGRLGVLVVLRLGVQCHSSSVPVGVNTTLRTRFVIEAAELARFLLGAFGQFYES